MDLKIKRNRKKIAKKVKKGFCGFPVATIGHYGPTDKKATKVVVGVMAYEEAEADPLKKWFSKGDVRTDGEILHEILELLIEYEVKSVVMPDRVIDYPDGEECPVCPFWKGRDRWTGEQGVKSNGQS